MSNETHELKCWPEYSVDIERGDKEFEVRRGNDRDYHVGDWLELREFGRKSEEYTGRVTYRQIKYVMHGPPFLPEDTWVLGFERH